MPRDEHPEAAHPLHLPRGPGRRRHRRGARSDPQPARFRPDRDLAVRAGSARGPSHAGRGRCGGACARDIEGHPRVRVEPRAHGAPRRASRDYGLPRRGARPSGPDDPGDERLAARDGGNRALRAVQPRPAYVVPNEPCRPGQAFPPGTVARLAKLPPAVLLLGPTASGKTPLALALARLLPVEIVSVDSAQIYRGMDVGTSKPSASEREGVPHHLVDIIDPTEAYSAARFRADALRLMDEITARGRTPLLVGGTMLYFKALREGLSELPESDAGVRAQLDAEAAARGWPALHAELARVDPQTAARLKPNDAQRIQRALEVFRVSGEAISQLLGRRKRAALPFRLIELALVPSDRSALHRRIEARFDAMLKAGLVEELRSLRERYALRPGLPSMRCVGYRQAWQFLEGEFDRGELRDRGIFATRQLAKRQLTWLRGMQGVQVFDCLERNLEPAVRDRVRAGLGSATTT